MMASIKAKHTKPEQLVRRYLHASGLRFRLHDRQLQGTPDLVLKKYHAVVFVNGCFWHRHPGCPGASTPATRPDFWATKFAKNVARDLAKSAFLVASGWRVFTVWECQAHDELALDHLFWNIVSEP